MNCFYGRNQKYNLIFLLVLMMVIKDDASIQIWLQQKHKHFNMYHNGASQSLVLCYYLQVLNT